MMKINQYNLLLAISNSSFFQGIILWVGGIPKMKFFLNNIYIYIKVKCHAQKYSSTNHWCALVAMGYKEKERDKV